MTDATESFAEDEIYFEKPEPSIRDLRVYYSVIVTTAKIKVCRFNPNDILIAEGTLSNADFETVPFIRFRKSLTTKLPSGLTPKNLTQSIKAKERTVLVVNASNLTGLLNKWALVESSSQPWSRQ
jgi:hypothetical protein